MKEDNILKTDEYGKVADEWGADQQRHDIQVRQARALEDLVVVAKEMKKCLDDIDLNITNVGDHIDSIDSTLEDFVEEK